ncbi:hypothetical protein B4072_2129 [Bacillus subtilis]|nr:hypothetical protein B4069_2062 [Bacillus subtilis]KIN44614.1 hypothetical protein B4072_2129 [Bacillus subtilis]
MGEIVLVIKTIAVLIDTYGELIYSLFCGIVAAIVTLFCVGLFGVICPSL